MNKSFLYIIAVVLLAACSETAKPAFNFTETTITDSTAIEATKPITLVANEKVTWQVSGKNTGTIDANGVYMPPVLTTANPAIMVTITAINQADVSKKITRTLYITPKANLINNLQKGGYVLSFRHGNASTGADQTSLSLSTNWWISCLSTQARQLDSPSGFVQMQNTGQAMRNLKIGVGKIISSEFCRCKQSAENLNFKNLSVELNKDISFYVYEEVNRYPKTMNLIATQAINSKNTVIVTHAGFSGTLPNPAPLNSLNWGDAAVFKLQNGATPQFVDVITTQEWVSLK